LTTTQTHERNFGQRIRNRLFKNGRRDTSRL